MDIKYKKSSDSLFIYFYGELDEYSATQSKMLLDKLIDDNYSVKKVIFNLSGLSFMDSTGIGMLIGRYKRIKRFNIDVFIGGANFNIEKVIELSGLYTIMPKY